MCILDLNKTYICDFHYNYIKIGMEKKAFTDTNGLVY